MSDLMSMIIELPIEIREIILRYHIAAMVQEKKDKGWIEIHKEILNRFSTCTIIYSKELSDSNSKDVRLYLECGAPYFGEITFFLEVYNLFDHIEEFTVDKVEFALKCIRSYTGLRSDEEKHEKIHSFIAVLSDPELFPY